MGRDLYVCFRPDRRDPLVQSVVAYLARRVGSGHVFGAEAPGPESVARCDAVVVPISDGWLRPTGRAGRGGGQREEVGEATGARDDPADPVREALLLAAQRGKLIVPLLLGGAAMPQPEDLPDDLRFLHYRNAFAVDTGPRFGPDMARVWRAIDTHLSGQTSTLWAVATLVIGGPWFSLSLLLALLVSAGSLPVLGPLFAQDPLGWLLALGPLLALCTTLALHLLGHRRRVGLALLLLGSVALGVGELLRPGGAELPQFALGAAGFQVAYHHPLVPWLLTLTARPFLLLLLVVLAGATAVLWMAPSQATYSFRADAYRRKDAAERRLKAAGRTLGIYLSCRTEDQSETYRALRAYLDRHLVHGLFSRGTYALYEGTQVATATDPSAGTAASGGSSAAAEPLQDALQESVHGCTDVVVVIGPHWLAAADANGRRRLDDPDDPIRRELSLALRLGKELVPVLIDGADLPAAGAVPPELAAALRPLPIRVDGPRQRSALDELVARVLGLGGAYNSYRGLLVALVDSFASFSPEVFISYRRADSRPQCDRLARRLKRRALLGSGVFRDTDAIPAGTDFATVIEDALDESRAVLVLIGPRWTTETDRDGRRRLDEPHDLVRAEVAAALTQGKVTIPVLLDDTSLPAAAALPTDLVPLAGLSAVRVRGDDHFRRDVAQLAAEVRRRLGIERHPLPAFAAAATAALMLLASVSALVAPTLVVSGLLSIATACSAPASLLAQSHGDCPIPFASAADAGTAAGMAGAAHAWVAVVGCVAVALLAQGVVAVGLMLRRRQWGWTVGVTPVLIAVGAALGLLLALLRGAMVSGIVLGGGTRFDLPEFLVEVGTFVAAFLGWNLARYFWRSEVRSGL